MGRSRNRKYLRCAVEQNHETQLILHLHSREAILLELADEEMLVISLSGMDQNTKWKSKTWMPQKNKKHIRGET